MNPVLSYGGNICCTGTAVQAGVAHNGVHHSKQYPSQITVTVVKRPSTSSAGEARR